MFQKYPSTTPRQFIAELERAPDHTHVLLTTTGSVASVKAPLIIQELLKYSNVEVEVVAIQQSLAFFDTGDVEARVWTDADEWSGPYTLGDPILHTELRRWADIILVAPCSANTLGKIAVGLCDNLVTSLLRALAPTTPTYIFPAMNHSCLGAMTEWKDIVKIVVEKMQLQLKP